MNILIPDSWLRLHLKTDATPKQLKDCLSLCGPSIERINTIEGETVYDIEVTTNRVDMTSVRGIAREAAVILPEFGIPATLLPFQPETNNLVTPKKKLDIVFENEPDLCYRILALKISDITLKDSPEWLKKRLELVGQRPLNNVIDITNYVMWEVGHPMHAFDYDRLVEKKFIVRLAKKGEKLKTLDNKSHSLHGGEIIFEDGNREIIDLPGIMGTANTVVTPETKQVLLFIENSDPVRIRRASMGLSIRSQAAVLNEKHPDPELALVAMKRAVQLVTELTGGTIDSELTDIYPVKPQPKAITVHSDLINHYMGEEIDEKRVTTVLKRLGCDVKTDTHKNGTVFMVTPPTLRSDDLVIPEDIVEEVARIIGYHTIKPKLPDREPPMVIPDPELSMEEEIKKRLRDWGYTEIFGYSMISQKDLEAINIDPKHVYTIANPLSSDHVYMRPTLIPTMLHIVSQNLSHTNDLSLFELSHTYQTDDKNLPIEQSELIIATTGEKFLTLKGIAQALFTLFGIPFSNTPEYSSHSYFNKEISLDLKYGGVGLIHDSLLKQFEIKEPITVLSLNISQIVRNANPHHSYEPIPKHPPVIEEFTFTVPEKQFIGPMIETIKNINPLIQNVVLLNMYKQNRSIRVTYLNPEKTLTVEEVRPIRDSIIKTVKQQFQAVLVGEEEKTL